MAIPTAPVMAGIRAATRGISTTNADSRSAFQPACSARLPLAKQFVFLTPRANRTLRRRAVLCMSSSEQQETSSSRTVSTESNLNVIIEKERRLAEAEAGLAEVENNLARKEQELLEMLLRQRSEVSLPEDALTMQIRVSKAEAEAAALKALITSGRSEVSALQGSLEDRPVVRTLWQWEDTEWAALNPFQKVAVWFDIIVGRTTDELRDEWAIARANGFGLRGLQTLLLVGTFAICTSYAILALAPASAGEGGVIAASLARPFALPASTLQVLARVVLSSLLVVMEHICTVIYFIPSFVAFPVAAGLLIYRQRCRAAAVAPFWDSEGLVRKTLGERRDVYVKRIPVVTMRRETPVFWRGTPIPQAVVNILTARGPGAWPPRPQPELARAVSVDMESEVRSLLSGRESAAQRGNIDMLVNTRLGSNAQLAKDVRGGGDGDFRLEDLQMALGGKPSGRGAEAAAAAAAAAAGRAGNTSVTVSNTFVQQGGEVRQEALDFQAPKPEGTTYGDVMRSFGAMRDALTEAEKKAAEINKKQ